MSVMNDCVTKGAMLLFWLKVSLPHLFWGTLNRGGESHSVCLFFKKSFEFFGKEARL
jgi:hypothetical protein